MANRDRRGPERPEQQKEKSRTGMWSWLKRTENQKTLQFVGAAIVAAVGLLVTIGVVHKPADIAPQATRSAQAKPPEPPAVVQNASAGSAGTAFNINGEGNQVRVEK
jgi:hypothetical protein